MSLSDLPSLDQVSRQRRDCRKGATESRLEQKTAKDKTDAKQLAVWRAEVRDRDEGKCRCCGVKTVKTLALHPRRGEAHHTAGRNDQAVRYDTRAGLHTCLKCHERITGTVNDRLELVGTVWFTKAGQRYLNCDYPVTFRKVA